MALCLCWLRRWFPGLLAGLALTRYAAELRAARARQPHPGRYAARVGIFVDLRRPDTGNRLFVLDPATAHPIQSWGCPALAPARLREMATLLQAQAGQRVLVCLR